MNTDFDNPLQRPQASPEVPLRRNLRIAQENGRFYNSMLDIYLVKEPPENKQAKIDQLIDSLPGPMKSLYREGMTKFQEELKANHDLIEQHRGEEVGYLLNSVMRSDEIDEAVISEVLQRATPDQARFIETFPGVAIIEAEEDFFRFLAEKKVIPGLGAGIQFGRDNRGDPGFMVIPRILNRSLADEGASIASDSIVRHEFHHFIWNFLTRTEFVRPVAEETPELSTAFRWFRDELIAYTIAHEPQLFSLNPWLLTYSKDENINNIAAKMRNFAFVSADVAQQRGIDSQAFIYAAMSAGNFDELRDNLAELTGLESQATQETVEALFKIWSKSSLIRSAVTELAQHKKMTVEPSVMKDYAAQCLSSPELSSVADI